MYLNAYTYTHKHAYKTMHTYFTHMFICAAAKAQGINNYSICNKPAGHTFADTLPLATQHSNKMSRGLTLPGRQELPVEVTGSALLKETLTRAANREPASGDRCPSDLQPINQQREEDTFP